MDKEQIEKLYEHYAVLASQLLALMKSNLLPEDSQEYYEVKMIYNRWLAKSQLLKSVLNIKAGNKQVT